MLKLLYKRSILIFQNCLKSASFSLDNPLFRGEILFYLDLEYFLATPLNSLRVIFLRDTFGQKKSPGAQTVFFLESP